MDRSLSDALLIKAGPLVGLLFFAAQLFAAAQGAGQRQPRAEMVHRFGFSAAFDAQLRAVDLDRQEYTVLAVRFCDDAADVMCRKFYRETYSFHGKEPVSIEMLTANDHAAESIDTETEYSKAIAFLKERKIDGFATYKTIPVETDNDVEWAIEVQHKIDAYRTLKKRVLLRHNGKTASLLNEGSGVLSRVLLLKKTAQSLWFGLDLRSCARACGGALEIYRIDTAVR